MANNVERAPGVFAFILVGPDLRQIAEKRVEGGGSSGEKGNGVQQIVLHGVPQFAVEIGREVDCSCSRSGDSKSFTYAISRELSRWRRAGEGRSRKRQRSASCLYFSSTMCGLSRRRLRSNWFGWSRVMASFCGIGGTAGHGERHCSKFAFCSSKVARLKLPRNTGRKKKGAHCEVASAELQSAVRPRENQD